MVLPVRNEAATIAAAVDSCSAQDYEGPIEVIVADGMSDDGTREVLLERSLSGIVTLIENPSRTTPSGLNRALENASGEVIVRCDAHSVLPSNYVRTAVSILTETGAGNVGGVQRAVGTAPMQCGIAYAMANPVGVGDARFHLGGKAGDVDTVYLGVFRADVVREVGGFDESLIRNQDYELNIRIREAGHRVFFDPRLVVDYSPRRSLSGLWRQYFDYGSWKRVVIGLHPSSLKLRQAGPPVLVVALLAGAVAFVTPWRGVGASLIIGYVTVLAAVGVFEAVRRPGIAGLLAAPAIGTMHIAWGSGFLVGRIRRRSRSTTSLSGIGQS